MHFSVTLVNMFEGLATLLACPQFVTVNKNSLEHGTYHYIYQEEACVCVAEVNKVK